MSEQYIYEAYYAGLEKAAEEAGLDKEAFWGALGSLALKGMAGIGKGVGSAAKAAWTPIKSTWGMVENPTAAGFSRMGGWAQKGLNKVMSPRVAKHVNPYLQTAFKDVPGQMANFGLISGGLGAATADEGKRLEGFGKGFVGGALSGMGWGVGSNVLKGGLTHSLKTYGGAQGKAVNKWLGKYTGDKAPILGPAPKGKNWTGMDRLKALGGATVGSAVPMVGAYYLSEAMTPNFDEEATPEPAAMEPPTGQQVLRSPYLRSGLSGATSGSIDGSW